MSKPAYPGSHGCRLLPSQLDYNAAVTPDRIYASVPLTHDIADGFRDITTREVLDAVDSFAWWLRDRFGPSDSFETLAYAGIADLRYVIFFYGAVKCGYKALFVSPRNPLHQNVSLLLQTKCTKFFSSPELVALTKGLEQDPALSGLRGYSVAPFDEWVASYRKPYPYTKTLEEARYDDILVLHSSGSTGAPKPIVINNQYVANSERPPPSVPGREIGGHRTFYYEGGGYFFSPFPPFHLAGWNSISVYPVFAPSATLVMGFPDRPATPQLVHRIMCQRKLRALYIPPSIIEQLVQMPAGLEMVKKLDIVVYAGGPLGEHCGDAIAPYVQLSAIYGSTEIGCATVLVSRPDDWSWLEFHPAFKANMEPAIDGAYEFVVKKDPEADPYRCIGGTFLRQMSEFRSKDLFLPHPSKPGLWRFHGRNDDILVLSNGEKWNPVPSERVIMGEPKVSGVLIVGDGRFQPAALIEPKEPIQSEEQFIQEVWPSVERANQQAQTHGRLVRSKIAIVNPDVFVRAPKGTIVRSSTAQKLNSIIDRLYSEDNADDAAPTGPVLVKPYDLQEAVLQFVQSCTKRMPALKGITDDQDFFVRGLDSLQAIELGRLLRGGLMPQYNVKRLTFITAQLIFDNPTINQLSTRICGGLSAKEIDTLTGTRRKSPTDMVNKYTLEFEDRRWPLRSPQRTNDLCVLLTGSTGSLGRQMLDVLLKDPTVSKVICLDRDPKAGVRARQALSLPKDAWSKVSFKKALLGEPNLGLLEDELKLFEQVDLLVHCAWRVDFNHSLASFEPQLHGVAQLISLLASNTRTARLFFISSMSSVCNLRSTEVNLGAVPEAVVEDDSMALPMGYGQSKQVAERIIARAALKAAIPATIIRLGQIAGAVQLSEEESTRPHQWNEKEWVPSLIATSKELGQIPSDLPTVDWIPANTLARIMSELIRDDIASDQTLVTYNVINPRTTEWSSLLPAVQETMGTPCSIVPFAKWLATLKVHDPESEGEAKKYPVLKMLPFFEGFLEHQEHLTIDTKRAQTASPSLSQLEPVNAEWMRQWMREWGHGQAAVGKSLKPAD